MWPMGVLTFYMPILLVYLAENNSHGYASSASLEVLLVCSSSSLGLRQERVFALEIVSVISVFSEVL